VKEVCEVFASLIRRIVGIDTRPDNATVDDSRDPILRRIAALAGEYDATAEPFVVQCLHAGHDVAIAAAALDLLCRRWSRTAEYLDAVHLFVRGVAWDEGDRLRLAAIAIAGAWLQEREDLPLLYELIDIAERGDGASDAVRDGAVRALARATGYRGKPISLDL